MQPTGILISSGFSKRMRSSKPLLTFKGKTFIVTILLKILPACSKVIVVTGHEEEKVQEEVTTTFNKIDTGLADKVEFVYNPEYKQGMLTSLQQGLISAVDSNWFLYHFVDQPSIPQKFYEEFTQKIKDSYDWVQPRVKEQSGHPIMFNKKVAAKILLSSRSKTLRDIIRESNFKKLYWECPYPEVLKDVDTPEEYAKLTSI